LTCWETKFAKGIGLPGRIWTSGEPAWIANVLEDNNFPRAPVAITAGLRGAFGFPILLGREVIGIVEFFSREIRQPDPELLQMVASIGGQIGQFQERKRAEGELAKLLLLERSARAEAEQANRLKDEFLATVSHELRTPLNAMMGWARMLRSGRLDTESRDHALEVIERNAWAQKQIIEDILDVSRVITGKLHLNLSPVDLRTVADAALDTVRPALEAKEIQIKRTMDPSVRVIVGDSDRLQQVIWNLLSNAAKFTPAGGQIELSVQHENNHIKIQVGDTGSGIDPDFLPYVFERFRQADGSTTRTHGGLGLGLAIVRHLVELHGGSIKAENRKESQGAILTVSLPLPSGELRIEDVPGAFVRDADSSPEFPNLEGCRILVVDDETDARDLIGIDLTACGAKITSFSSAAEALQAFAQSEFDLLISDIGMPKFDGYEFIRSVRAKETAEQRRKTPAIALTSYARVQDRLRALIAGYDTHVAKPLESGELVTVVASLVGRLAKK
jgi:signal transduction histidine kinase/CheY-like chemotaxis protein